jgi:hypothetical protein
MAKDVEVNLNVNNNVQGSIAELKKLKKQLKDTEVGTEAFKNLYNQIDDLEDKIKSAKNTSSDWVDSLAMAGGPIGSLGTALNSVKVATQSFSGALKASGIGLLVSLIGGLVAAFNDSEKATKKLQPLLNGLEKIFNGVYAAVEPLFNVLIDFATSALPLVSKAMQTVYGSVTAVVQSLGSLGSAVFKFVKGDFSGAWQEAKASVTDFGKNYDDAIKRFSEGSKELTKTEKEELDKRNKLKEEQAKKNEEDLAKQYQKNEQLLKDYNAQQLEEYNNRTKNFENLKLLNTGYLQKVDSDSKTFAKSSFKNLVERLDAEIAAEKKKKDESINITQVEHDTKIAIQEAYADNVMRLGQGLRQIAGENKELAIAGIVLEQAAAVAKIAMGAQVNFTKNGGVTSPLAWIGLAGDVAAGLSAVSAGVKGIQDINSGTASGGQMSFGNQQMTPSYQVAPRFNVVGVNPMNQAAQALQSTGPIEAYVVASKVTTAQALDRNKITSATLG